MRSIKFKNKNIHIFNSHGIGDVIMTIPLITRVLRENPKKISLTLKSEIEKNKIDIFFPNQNIKFFFFKNKKNISFKNFSFIRSLRKEKIDLIIFTEGIDTKRSLLLSLLLNVRKSIPTKLNLISKILKNDIDSSIHKAIKNYKLITNNFEKDDFDLSSKCYFNAEDLLIIEKTLKDKNIKIKENFIVIAPGSGELESYKRWPVDRYKKLILKITNLFPDLTIFILGNDLEEKIGKELSQINRNVRNLCGELSIKESMYLLSLCKISITNCNGISHMAGAVGSLVIGIYGPTDYKKTGPFTNNLFPVTEKKYAPWYSKKNIDGLNNSSNLKDVSEDDVLKVFLDVFQKDRKDFLGKAYRHVELDKLL